MHTILTFKKTMFFVAAAAIFMSLTISSGQSYAQAADVTPTDQAEKTTETFDVYTAVPGDNVTALVRRSIIEFDQTNDEIELSSAQIVFAETNIVQELMCDDILHVGQKVSISQSKIKNYTEQALSLDSAQLASWETYANNVSFVLTDRTLATAEEANEEPGTGSGEATNAEQAGEPGDDSSDDDTDKNDGSEDNDAASNLYWWIIGGGAVLAGWHLLGKQNKA